MLDTENECTETYLKDLSCENTKQVIKSSIEHELIL